MHRHLMGTSRPLHTMAALQNCVVGIRRVQTGLHIYIYIYVNNPISCLKARDVFCLLPTSVNHVRKLEETKISRFVGCRRASNIRHSSRSSRPNARIQTQFIALSQSQSNDRKQPVGQRESHAHVPHCNPLRGWKWFQHPTFA